MTIVQWLRRLWYLLNRSRFEHALQEEMLAHREMMAEPRGFGNTLRLGEEARDAWGWNWLDSLWRDVRYGLRGLRREPTFALAAILTLTLGVATTTTVFSVVDAELWKPLPFPRPQQLVAIYSRGPGTRAMSDTITGQDLAEWRGAPAFSQITAVGRTSRQILQLETAQSIALTEVTVDYFTALGRSAIIGTVPVTGPRDGTMPAVLTDRAWKRLFGADPSVVGRNVILNGETATLTGVIKTDDSLGPDPDLYVVIDERLRSFADASVPVFSSAIGRLRPGVERTVARAQLEEVEARLAQAGTSKRNGHFVFVEDLQEYFAGNNWRPLYFFLGASLVVLLLSVVNVATLVLARTFRRTRELALRGALGGGRRALMQTLAVEAGLVALAGAFAGAVATRWAIGFFTAQLPSDFLLRGAAIPIDYRVYAFVFAAAGLITVAFALAPLGVVRRFDLSRALGAGARAGSSVSEGRTRGALLTAQLALTVVLLTGAGIFLKSFIALNHAPLGFEPGNTLSVRASLSGVRYATDEAIRGYASRMLDAARSTPGVRQVSIASSSPLGSGPMVLFAATEQRNMAPGDGYRAILRAISPGYFQTLGIHITKGRDFSAVDGTGGARVAIVNESLARQLFGAAPAVGQSLELLPGARVPWTKKPGTIEIVGVTSNVKDVGVNEVEFANIYVPFDQVPAPWVELIARVDGQVTTLGSTLSASAARLDPMIPVSAAVAFDERLWRELKGDRFNTLLVSGFAVVALMLAAVGIFGAVAYNVQARTREFGVRLALGAQPRWLVGSALWQAARFGLAGSAFGLAGALAVATLIGDAVYLVPGSHNGLLYGVSTTDPAMLAAAVAGILVVALAAAAIPARRVARVDPVSALRAE